MKPMMMVGLLLVVLGIVALLVPTVTFFTHERVADAGWFKIDVQKPHTIVMNPAVGGLALAVGLLLVMTGRRSAVA